jgi:hypothetical protein
MNSATELENYLNFYWQQYQQRTLSKGDVVSIFLILYNELFPTPHWLNYNPDRRLTTRPLRSSFSPKDDPYFSAHPILKKAKTEYTLGMFMNQCLFKKETLRSNLGLMHIYTHPESIHILDYIPTPMQILEMQAAGYRCVTLLRSPNWFDFTFDHKRNLRDFVIHDLEHIWQMFEHSALTASQVSFSQQLLGLTQAGSFDFLLNDEKFAGEFNYIISDMNTHPAHTYATLKSLVIRQKSHGQTRLSTAQEQEIIDIMQHFDGLVTSAQCAPQP